MCVSVASDFVQKLLRFMGGKIIFLLDPSLFAELGGCFHRYAALRSEAIYELGFLVIETVNCADLQSSLSASFCGSYGLSSKRPAYNCCCRIVLTGHLIQTSTLENAAVASWSYWDDHPGTAHLFGVGYWSLQLLCPSKTSCIYF